MTPELLIKAGMALYPIDWSLHLACDLDINQRRLRRMANGSAPIPDGLAADLLALLQNRGDEFVALVNRLLEAS